LKMEQAFQLDTVREIRYFVYLPWIGKERRNFLIPRLTFGMSTKNEKFESLLLGDLDLKFLSRQMFFVWDDNHKLQAWLPYIQLVHNEDFKWHYSMDYIMLNIVHGLVKLLTSMIDMNKLVFHLSMNPCSFSKF
jgi:hypothetical protein